MKTKTRTKTCTNPDCPMPNPQPIENFYVRGAAVCSRCKTCIRKEKRERYHKRKGNSISCERKIYLPSPEEIELMKISIRQDNLIKMRD